MWERWKQGWTLHQIAQLFNRAHTSVQGILARTGGIRPPPRTRASTALTLAEREEISRAMVEGHSIRSIASRLGRAPSTVSRELSRNGGRASLSSKRRRQRSLDSRASPQVLQTSQEQSLGADRDRQASVRCGRPSRSPDGSSMLIRTTRAYRVSHETIYRSLFIQARGALKKELLQHLRRTRGMRRSRHHTQKTDIHGQITGRGLDQRTPGIGRGPRGAWPLGRRSAVRLEQQPDRHAGGAANALPHARQARSQGHRDGRQRADQEHAQAAAGAVQVADLGSRQGDGRLTSASRWRPTSRSTSAIHAAHGSAAATRTPTACSGSTCPRASTSLGTHKPS